MHRHEWRIFGFFDIGMIQRNEANAIIVHGTHVPHSPRRAGVCRGLVERYHRRGL